LGLKLCFWVPWSVLIFVAVVIDFAVFWFKVLAWLILITVRPCYRTLTTFVF
jgi:hypothetical protein